MTDRLIRLKNKTNKKAFADAPEYHLISDQMFKFFDQVQRNRQKPHMLKREKVKRLFDTGSKKFKAKRIINIGLKAEQKARRVSSTIKNVLLAKPRYSENRALRIFYRYCFEN